MKISTAYLIIFTNALFNVEAQFSCPDSMIYVVSSGNSPTATVRVFNPNQPISVNNPSFSTMPVSSPTLSHARGLALLPNLNGGQPSPTLYSSMVISSWPSPTVIHYCYWNGTSWVDTGTPIPQNPGYINFSIAGCNSALFSLYKKPIGGGSVQYVVYANYGTGGTLGQAVPIFTAQAEIAAEELVCDCNCNIYLLHRDGLRKYDQNGNVLSFVPSSAYLNTVAQAFTIIGNTLYVDYSSTVYSADISGSSFSLTPLNLNFSGTDYASCPVATTTTVSATINSGTLGCNPSTLNLVASTTLNPASYQWSGPGIGSAVPGPSVMNVNSAGIFTCHIFEGSCDYRLATLVTTVTSNTTTVMPSILPGSLLCLSPAMKLTATVNPGNYNYQWSGPDITAGQGTATVTINDTGKYELIVTNPENGCSGIASTSILPVPLPELGISSPTLCVYSVYGKDKATLSYNGADTYTLLLSPGFSISLLPSQPIVLYQTHAPPSITGAASATLIGGNGVCTGSTVTNFSVLPVTTLSAIPSHTTVCSNSKIQLSATGAESYTWFPLQAFDWVQHNNVQVTVNKNASYSVQGVDKYGCHTPPQTFYVDVFPLHNGRIKPHEAVCAGQCPELNFESFSADPASIISTWTANNQHFEGALLKPCFASPGSYTINAILTDTNTTCNNGFEYILNVHPKPLADFSFNPLQPVEGRDEVLFESNTTDTETNKWYWPDPETGKTKSSETEAMLLRFLSAGNYPVTLVSTNQWRCADTLTKVVEVAEDLLFYIPNTFTPNNDGRNDVFSAVVHGLRSFSIEIYNRWGTLLFSSEKVEQGWDGTFKGYACPEGSYTWKAAITSKRGTPKEYSGHVLLMR